MSERLFLKRRGHRAKKVILGALKGMIVGAAAGIGKGNAGLAAGTRAGIEIGERTAIELDQRVIKDSLVHLIHYWASVPLSQENEKVYKFDVKDFLRSLRISPSPDLIRLVSEEVRRTGRVSRVMRHARRWENMADKERLEQLSQARLYAIPSCIQVVNPPIPRAVFLNLNRGRG